MGILRQLLDEKVPLNEVSVGLEVPYFSVALGHSERLLAYARGR